MPIINIKCPKCGTAFHLDSNLPFFTCSHCHSKSFMEDAIIHNYILQNTVDMKYFINAADADGFVFKKNYQDADWEKYFGATLEKYVGESENVIIPDNVSHIGDGAFESTNIKTVSIPSRVYIIGSKAFMNCKALAYIKIPGGVSNIALQAFKNCTSLSDVRIPNSVEDIYSQAFAGCTSLTSISIPNSAKSVDAQAFEGCVALKSIAFSYGIKEIGKRAFAGCTSLTSVVIPESVKKIDEEAFSGCSSLTSVTLPKGKPLVYSSTFEGTPYQERTLQEFRRKEGRCPYCGGYYKGKWFKVCSRCGKPKDY